MHSYFLMDQVRHLYHTGHYKNAFKACSGLLKLAAGDRMSRISVTKAVDRINSELLLSLGDKKVKKSTIHDAISRGGYLGWLWPFGCHFTLERIIKT